MYRAGRALWAGIAVLGMALLLGTALSGQTPSPSSSAPLSEIVAELRALRVELAQSRAASTRAQLLAIRLQLQEQRIATVARQLSDVQQRLGDNQQSKATLAAQMKLFEQEFKERGDKEELGHVGVTLRAQLAQLATAEQQLQAQEASLSQLLSEEQGRWMQFNEKIEQLEKALAEGRVPER